MEMMVPKSITVIVDTREQRPLLFPDTFEWFSSRSSTGRTIIVHIEKKCMKTGDYALKGFEDLVLIERKGSVQEIHNNLFTDDRKRSDSSFERLAKCTTHPYLLLDMSPAAMWKPTKYTVSPQQLFDELMSLTTRLGIQVWYAGQCKVHKSRRILGEQMIRLMMAHAFRKPIEDDKIDNALSRIPL